MKRFEGKTVIVTGAGVGIGEATAIEFAKEGANVVVNSQSESGLRTVNKIIESGGNAVFVQGDISEEETAVKIRDKAIDEYGRIDILINNAGVVIPGTIETITPEQFDKTIAVNVRGVYLMTKAVVDTMKKQGGGAIVNNASVAAIKAVRNRIAYAASKGAVVSMSRCMALDLAKDHIRINCVAPGMTLTPSLGERIKNSEDPVATEKEFKSLIPLGRFAQTSEIARVIMFLASDDAGFITGVVLPSDGGKSA